MSGSPRWLASSCCPCGGDYTARTVEVRLPAREGFAPAVLPSVRQAGCETCGSRVYSAADLHRIESIFKPGRPPGESQ